MSKLINKKIFFLIFLLCLGFFTFSYAQETTFLTGNNGFTNGLAESKGFAGLFNNLFKIVVGLGAAWAVISLVYWGAKYALVNSVTGKSAAKENLMPVFVGLVALLGTYIIFNQINPKILALDLNTPKLNDVRKYNEWGNLFGVDGKDVKNNLSYPVGKPVGGTNNNKNKEEFIKYLTENIGRVQNFCKNKIGGTRETSIEYWKECVDFINKSVVCVSGSDAGKQESINSCVYILNNFDNKITIINENNEKTEDTLWNIVFGESIYNKDFFQKIRKEQAAIQ